MTKPIEHTGIVTDAQGSRVLVHFSQETACAACHARSMCMSAESKEKEVWAYPLESLQVGDRVLVQVAERLAWRAVVLAYGLPLIVMVVVLMLLSLFMSEWLAGCLSLIATAIYYVILSFFRNRLEKQFDFTARKL